MHPFLTPQQLTHQTAWLLGTFNPIHAGHLVMAQIALQQFGLKQVVLTPAGNSPWKHTDSAMTPCYERVVAITHAIADIQGLTIDPIECEWAAQQPEAPTFSWQTIPHLKSKHGISGRIPILMGSDTVAGVKRWALPPDAPPSWWVDELCILQAPRQGTDWVACLTLDDGTTVPLNTLPVAMPLMPISSTQLRQLKVAKPRQQA